MNDLLSINEVLALAGVSLDTSRRYQRTKKFPRPSHKRGRQQFWTRADVEKAIAGLTRPISDGKQAAE
jgi:predicted DNA-binding transcriptional regulator AlpA